MDSLVFYCVSLNAEVTKLQCASVLWESGNTWNVGNYDACMDTESFSVLQNIYV